MKRTYDTGTADNIIFFTGIEVEKTPAFGLKTLFVTGVQDYNEIMKFYQRRTVRAYLLWCKPQL